MLFNSSSQRFYHAARLALAAMLLLTIGPLIGQLSAFDDAPHQHDAAQMSMADAPHEASDAGWHAVCGYCSLFQQIPVLDALRLDVLKAFCRVAAAPVPRTQDAQGAFTTFPHALTRAPPLAS